MGLCRFNHVKITGIKGVVPERVINIDDEIQYYDNDPKKLARNKKILGLGTRHVVDEGVTSADLCEEAARLLFKEMNINTDEIDALIVASTTPDRIVPSTAHRLHGKLCLNERCSCLDMNGGCTALIHALWLAHSLIESEAARKVLVLGGDILSRRNDVRNRISSMIFSDAGGAVLLERTQKNVPSYFLTGSRGKNWDTLVVPAGGERLPVRKDIADIEITDATGNVWHLWDDIMKGMDVFNFTMEIGPKSISEILEYAGLTKDDIDLFALHQANKQIVDTIRKHANLPSEKTPSVSFERHANCSTIAVLTVLLDCLKPEMKRILMCTFGVGLSWGSCIVNTDGLYNGGISVFKTPQNIPSRQEKINYWTKYFKNETSELSNDEEKKRWL